MPTIVKVPYETLVRYRRGLPSAAHVRWSLLVTEDDGMEREIPQDAEPLDIGHGKGFPLATILDQTTIAALVTISEQDSKIKDLERKARGRKDVADAGLVAQIAAKDAELSAKITEHAAEKAAKDAELAFIKLPEKEKVKAHIQAEIDRLQKAKDDLDKSAVVVDPKKPK